MSRADYSPLARLARAHSLGAAGHADHSHTRMSTDTLETYRHSGKFNPHGVVLPIVAAAVLGFPLGYVYAYGLRWIPFIYVNILLTFAYGFGFGWLTSRILKASHVRNTTLATLCGLGVGLIALYWEWDGHLHALFTGAPWFFRPDQIVRGMGLLYKEGSWGFHGTTVTGIPLALVWVVEAAIIVGVATAIPAVFVRDTPFCEQTRTWLDEEKKINTLEPLLDETAIAALRAGDLMPLANMKAKFDGAAVYTRLILKRAPARTAFCTLRVQNVSVSIESDGKIKEQTEDFTGDLILPSSMHDLIARYEEFVPLPKT